MKADVDLVREVKEGTKASFSELVKRHQKSVYRMALRFMRDHDLAEDVVQEAFVKAYKKIGTFEERSSFKSWVFRIAINTAKNKLRSAQDQNVNIDDHEIAVEAQVHEEFEYKEVHGFVSEEVLKLPDRQQMALRLRVFEDLSFQEIAQIMDCPYDTAKANYRHAVLKIKKALAKQFNIVEKDEVSLIKKTILNSPEGD